MEADDVFVDPNREKFKRVAEVAGMRSRGAKLYEIGRVFGYSMARVKFMIRTHERMASHPIRRYGPFRNTDS